MQRRIRTIVVLAVVVLHCQLLCGCETTILLSRLSAAHHDNGPQSRSEENAVGVVTIEALDEIRPETGVVLRSKPAGLSSSCIRNQHDFDLFAIDPELLRDVQLDRASTARK